MHPDEWKARLKAMGLSRVRSARKAASAVKPSSAASTRELGSRGEDEAARYLGEQGVQVVARNVRFADGELDLVGQKDGVLIFVEVKWRHDALRGRPGEAVTSRKRARVRHAALQWLAENGDTRRREIRFDVVAILEEPYQIDWIQGAFDAS